MDAYEEKARQEVTVWQEKMVRRPSFSSQITKGIQDRLNRLIPERAHRVITEAIKNMVKAVLLGSEFISGKPLNDAPLAQRERLVREKIDSYRKIAGASGFGIGSGGFLLALADFPILLGIKMKLLFDIAGLYGLDVRDLRERIFILHIFQLAFSSPEKRPEVYQQILRWEENRTQLPMNTDDFDWRTFQQEYRDYIDLAKMLQLVPGIGAFVGAYANYQLVEKLGQTAIQAYRLRLLHAKRIDAQNNYEP